MQMLVADVGYRNNAVHALRSCGFAYFGPTFAPNGKSVIDAIDRVVSALRPSPLADGYGDPVKVEEEDVFAASYALPSHHWLRQMFARNGLRVARPAPQKFVPSRI